MGFPPPKKWEAGTDLHLNRVIQDQQVAGGDVSDFISVIDVLSSSWENGLCEEKQQSVPQLRVSSSGQNGQNQQQPLSIRKQCSHTRQQNAIQH